MDFHVCARCGQEIEGMGIHFRKGVFCSDECCEEFEAELSEKIEPDLDNLEVDDFDDDDDDDLGFDDDDIDADLLDDEFDIKPEDF